MPTPMRAIRILKMMPQSSEWRNTWRALPKSLAPMKWATCTEKPVAKALSRLPISQVVDSMSPMLAEASAPKCPTIEASIKNIMTVEICASMEGILKPTMRFSFSPRCMERPARIDSIRYSVFLLYNIMFVLPFIVFC